MKAIEGARPPFVLLCCVVAGLLLTLCASCIYMKMDPPPDADKNPLANNNSCYLATASNMLAGAGYGTGNTVQARADDIYAGMIAQYGITDGGWTDAALQWWLNSTHNTWPNNPYTVVTVYGHKSPKYPWANTNGARDIGNELRRCQMVGLSISWPTDSIDPGGNPVIGSGGHAITGWGDNNGDEPLTDNPLIVRVADSDRETGGDVQKYTYDSYTSPNPGGPNEGNGWYINFDNNHPYIKHIVTLCPTDDPSDQKMTQRVLGSYKIHQSKKMKATDLHYEVGTDVIILTYKTEVNWPADDPPSITESQPQRRNLEVDWEFTRNPVPYCTWVTINTEFILPMWNAIVYRDVHFTYPELKIFQEFPHLKWQFITPVIDKAESILNVTGGYVIGSFDIINPDLPPEDSIVAQYRFIHQYSYNQAPEDHMFSLSGDSTYFVTNLRFGHSYGYLDAESLWKFEDWMTEIRERPYPLGEKPIELRIDWKGRLPYPEGEDIKGRIPEIREKKR